jgi:hypothetical protein
VNAAVATSASAAHVATLIGLHAEAVND